ncbi:MAG TPA: protein phosphatase 2C domain-containing protein [Rhodanobacteraceae bacterium]
MIEHGHATHTGLARAHNEDNYWADAERGLWLVADGMGGPGRGEVASALALQTMLGSLHRDTPLPEAIQHAGAAIQAHPSQHGTTTPMGSTLAALKLNGADAYEVAWIGDSRVYLWQDGHLARVPHPARIPGSETDPAAAGEARQTSVRSRATQALGITPETDLHAESASGQCSPGMQFLLCSDGLTEELDDARIAAIVSRTDLAAQECVDHLMLAALERGGKDNITAVLVRIR